MTDDDPITFEEVQQNERKRRSERKKLYFELPEGEIWFEIRMLSPEEFDEVESAAVEIKERRNQTERTVNTTAFKNKLISEGVTDSSMPDWKATERHITGLPKEVRNELADAIDDFQQLDDETRYAFP